MKKLVITLFVSALILTAPSADAIIVTGDVTGGTAFGDGGVFQEIVPPIGDVGNNNHESPNLFGFNEDQNIVIGTDLTADIGSDLSTGDTVASHYIFFDPASVQNIEGYVLFDSEILAIMTSKDNLDDSDFLANVSANYLSPTLRGLEAFEDVVSIDGGNANRLNIRFQANSPGDYIRVLTKRSPGANTVPEPMTMALMGTGLVGMGVIRRKKA